MWRDFRPQEIALDLEALRAVGIEYLRAFIFWADFMPTTQRVEPVMLERLTTFFDLCQAAGLKVHLTFLVGHMSGENWSPVWLPDPTKLYSDPRLLELQEFYLHSVAAHIGDHAALSAFVLSNEMPIYGGLGDKASVGNWSSRLYDTLKILQPSIPVSIGDGAWYCLGEETGFSSEHAQDILGPHLYIPELSAETQRAAYGLSLGTAKALAQGREVWLEEFGASQSVFGEQEIAEFAYGIAFEARVQGASHVCWWCALDFELVDERPYSHHAFELVFGLLRSDRSPKPVARALRAAVDAPIPDLPVAGLLVPAYFHEVYPFSWDDREIVKRALLNSYATLRRLGYSVQIVLEKQFLETSIAPELLFVPSTQKLLANTWRLLERHVGHVVYSYFHGNLKIHQGAWLHQPKSFFGGVTRNHYGLPETAPTKIVSGFGHFALPKSDNVFASTPLLLEPDRAEVIGLDEFGRPMWVRLENRDLILYPIEALAKSPTELEAIYRAVLESVLQPQAILQEVVIGDD